MGRAVVDTIGEALNVPALVYVATEEQRNASKKFIMTDADNFSVTGRQTACSDFLPNPRLTDSASVILEGLAVAPVPDEPSHSASFFPSLLHTLANSFPVTSSS